MESELDRLARGKYLLVTTFRRNGTPVRGPDDPWTGGRGCTSVRGGGEEGVWELRGHDCG